MPFGIRKEIAKYAASVGIKDSNEAEFLAVVFALELILDQKGSLEHNIIIESDLRNTLSWIKYKQTCPLQIIFYYDKVNNILLILKDVRFVHVNR